MKVPVTIATDIDADKKKTIQKTTARRYRSVVCTVSLLGLKCKTLFEQKLN